MTLKPYYLDRPSGIACCEKSHEIDGAMQESKTKPRSIILTTQQLIKQQTFSKTQEGFFSERKTECISTSMSDRSFLQPILVQVRKHLINMSLDSIRDEDRFLTRDA